MFKPWLNSVVVIIAVFSLSQSVLARTEKKIPEPIYPVQTVLEDGKRETVYPSVAGNFVVYSQRVDYEFSVVRTSIENISVEGKLIAALQPNEAIRYGVAIKDGAIGYISNRMGPIGAWMRQGQGDGHVAIANMSTFTGALMPANLKASTNGEIWAFDSSLEKTRRARVLSDFSEGHKQQEFMGQNWRMYHSESWRYKQVYYATEPGTRNDFQAPALFLFDRKSSQLTMVPNAFNGAISPDAKQVVFVREMDGDYNLWMQGMDGSGLTQLTTNKFGDFEPVFSPDGKKIAFVSNRDSKGNVRVTSIYVMDLKSGKIERVTNALRATDGGPAWLDSRTIIFHSNRDPKHLQSRDGAKWNLWKVTLK